MKNNKGFTLVELLAVIVIMGILMMVAIPSVTRTIENSRKDSFVDIAKSYVNAVRTMWTSDNLICNGDSSSAVDDGDYYILINSKEGAKETLLPLVDQGGKSSWGNRDVSGYVRVNVSTTPGVDSNNDGTYEVEPRRVTKFFVALSDGTHGLIDDDTLTTDELKRGNVIMTLTGEQLKATELTTSDGKLNCSRSNFGTYVCTDVTPITNITGICTDDKTPVDVVGQIEINPISFATDDWITVVTSLKSGKHPYQVGDIKTVDMGSLGTHTIRIANLSTPSECNTSGFSQTACGVVLEFADIINTYKMNDAVSNVGGWPATKLRAYINSTIYNALPNELKSAIIKTTVVSSYGNTTGENNFTSKDKLYLLASKEVWENGASSPINYDKGRDITRQLDYYRNSGVTTSSTSGAIKKYNGTDTIWWLRSAYYSNIKSFFYAHTNGTWNQSTANYSRGVSPAFRIA